MSDPKTAIAQEFIRALKAGEWTALRSLLSEDATWTLPGDNQISGTASGADAVVERAQLIASYGPSFELLHILYSRDNVALSIRNQARRGTLVLDEHLATVMTLADGGRVTRIETYLSDVPGMNAFFADLP